MGKDQLEVISAAQNDRIERIKEHHKGCVHSFTAQMGHAFLCGVELNALKEECGHGNFTPLRERYLPDVPHSSAQRYMKFADLLCQNTHVGNFTERLQLTNGELPEQQKQKLLKAVYEIADGKTLTELYRDLGIIRKKKPNTGGGNATAKKNVRKSEEQKDADAEENVRTLLAALELARDDGDFKRITDETRDRARDLFIEIGKLLGAKKGKAK